MESVRKDEELFVQNISDFMLKTSSNLLIFRKIFINILKRTPKSLQLANLNQNG
jgi:hypothetical protein